MKKKLLIISILGLFQIQLFAQKTTLNLFIGGEATKLNDDYGDDVKIYLNDGFEAYSFLLGVGLEQELVSNFDLVLRASFGMKQVNEISERDLADGGPPFSINFPHIYNSFLIRKAIYKEVKIGGGIGYNLFKPSFRLEPGYGKEFTGIVESSFSVKRFNVNLSYTFGLENYFLESEKLFNLKTRPSKSFRLSVGYDIFSTTWKKRGKKVNCPKI